MKFGLIGSGSWATALAKILTDNGNIINWWVRNEETIQYLNARHHNPHYLSSVYFKSNSFVAESDLEKVIKNSEVLIIAVPSAYIINAIGNLDKNCFQNKKIISAVKGILPNKNLMLNEYLHQVFNFSFDNYFTVLGPCHAEEVASEKLSYLTFSGNHLADANKMASYFKTTYINTICNQDVLGSQYASVLKNIYALGAGIAHGLEYGDNFQSVYIANAANEMVQFLKSLPTESKDESNINYAASVYLGDLLVTCYSLFSRNRTFGNMIGKGYSVKAAQLELSMVAEGYNASKCIYLANEKVKADIPIATIIYKILWEQLSVVEGFKMVEKILV